MAAYVIANVEVLDPVRYEEYRRAVPATIAARGGRYLARGGAVTVLEGDCEPSRLVIVEFPSVEQAKQWWACDEYAELKKLRQATTRSSLVVVEGV